MLANTELDLHEEDDQTTNETKSGNEVFDKSPMQFPFVQKKDIKWINKPFQEPYINLTDLEPIDCPSTIPQPYEYFTKYFDQKIFEDLSFYTNLYAVQNNDFSFKPTSPLEIRSFIAIQMMMGVLKYPRIGMYWEQKFRVNIFADTMPRNRFYSIRQNIHIINNMDIARDNTDKFVKIRPLFDALNNRCKQLPVERNISVDEQIVPFKGQLVIKQYMKGKPNPWGIKIFLLCGQSGIVYNMILYQGVSTNINKDLQKNFGLVLSDKVIMKMGRGTSYEVTSTLGVGLLKWCDNKAITMASNFITSGKPESVSRWDKKNKQYVNIERPEIIKLYNKSMLGVDKHDQLVSYYRVYMKSRKWTLRMITHAFGMAVANSWLEYKQDAENMGILKKDQKDLLHFKTTLAEELVMVGRFSPGKKRGRPTSSPSSSTRSAECSSPTPAKTSSKALEFRPTEGVSKDLFGHFPAYDDKKEVTRCKNKICTELFYYKTSFLSNGTINLNLSITSSI
ncbi:piggyBac transposable element-derived protein 3-like [Rhopalosiphum padi]|uniref:piggyBac transposable element-derived protein 3-like n=1 Tax=Rhopalosiphum padi TaxID=40932 RepID=UPI00298D854B|nr:piggyBac transposable element-derived protein 3-like [Rhopalosiphum padi]